MNNEKDPTRSGELGAEQAKEVQETAAERRKELNEQLEQRAEASHEADVEKSKQEALEAASKVEKEAKPEVAAAEKPKQYSRAHRKKAEKTNFANTMKEARSHMSAPSKAFSKVIHNKAVEKTSDAVGNTVARPNAILFGSLTAFLFTLGIYLFARYYGYPLSGFETIAAFILGWVVGLLFDYLRVMITGKKA